LLSGRRVLVVEDEMLILMMIEDMLGDLGCNSVAAAPTAESAIAHIGGEPIDLAMLDMNLSGVDSHLVAEALDAHGVPFVFCTGNSGGGLREGVGKRLVLRKPFSFEDLTEAVTVLIEQHDAIPLHG
jgi:CheY-like chemotaxis protein